VRPLDFAQVEELQERLDSVRGVTQYVAEEAAPGELPHLGELGEQALWRRTTLTACVEYERRSVIRPGPPARDRQDSDFEPDHRRFPRSGPEKCTEAPR